MLHLSIRKANTILFVVQSRSILDIQLPIRSQSLGEDNLGQITPTDWAIVLPAQDPNSGGTLKTAQMIALPDGVILDRFEAHDTDGLVHFGRFRGGRWLDMVIADAAIPEWLLVVVLSWASSATAVAMI